MKNSNLLTVLVATSLMVLSACSNKHDDGVNADARVNLLDVPQECQGPQSSRIARNEPGYNRQTPYQPAPYQPAPYQPAPYQPAPYQPAPYQPAPYQPSQYQPAQYQPAQYQQSQYQPAYQPAPYQPAPYQSSQYQAPQYQSSQYSNVRNQTAPVQTAPDWNDYRHAGCSTYKWDEEGNFRHGGCPRGTFAACGAGVGMVCMPSRVYDSNEVAWYDYNQGSRDAHFCGYEGRHNRDKCTYRSHSRAGKIGRACVVADLNSCGRIGRCEPVSRRSVIGVCVH